MNKYFFFYRNYKKSNFKIFSENEKNLGGLFQLVLKQKNYAKKLKTIELGVEEGKMETFESLELIAEKFSQIIVLALKNNNALKA